MAAFVARFTRVIAQELRDAKSLQETNAPRPNSHPNSGTPATLITAGRSIEREVIQIDMRTAELLGNGTRIFPDPGTGHGSNWYIFEENRLRNGASEKVFIPSGMIAGASNSEEFVASAYQHILKREVDATGLQLYPSLIENRQLSRRDVLIALADSDEASERSIKLVIVPEPSSWLGTINVGQVIPCLGEGDSS